jgi:hypothetical protein
MLFGSLRPAVEEAVLRAVVKDGEPWYIAQDVLMLYKLAWHTCKRMTRGEFTIGLRGRDADELNETANDVSNCERKSERLARLRSTKNKLRWGALVRHWLGASRWHPGNTCASKNTRVWAAL